MKHYFAADGNYGDASDCVVVDTSDFTDSDWEELGNLGDNGRMEFLGELIDKYRPNWKTVSYMV
jgi:hypothetical protein